MQVQQQQAAGCGRATATRPKGWGGVGRFGVPHARCSPMRGIHCTATRRAAPQLVMDPPSVEQGRSPERTLNSTSCGTSSSSRHRTHWQYRDPPPDAQPATSNDPPPTAPAPSPPTTVLRRSPKQMASMAVGRLLGGGEGGTVRRRGGGGGGGDGWKAGSRAQALPGLGHSRHTCEAQEGKEG